MFMVVNFVVLY